MQLKLWQQVNLSLLLPILIASIIVLYAVYTLGTVSKRIDFIETADDINLTLLELRRYEKNILLFNEEENTRKFYEHLSLLDAQVRAAENQIVEEIQRKSYKPLLENIRKYRDSVQELISAVRTEHDLLDDIRPMGRIIEQKAWRRDAALELRRHEKNYIIYRERSAVDRVHQIASSLARSQPDLQVSLSQYSRVFDALRRSEETKAGLIETMRREGRAIEKITLDFAGRKREAIDRAISGSRRLLIASLVVLLVSTTLVALHFSTNVARTLRTMEKSFARLTRGDFAYGIDIQSARAPAEILSFIGAYNETIDKLRDSRAQLEETLAELEHANRELLDRQDELVEARKMTAMRLLASEIAHEINNPLSSLSMFLGVCHEELREDEAKKGAIALMLKEVSRCRLVLNELVDFARKEPLKLREVNPVVLLKDAVKVVRGQHEDRLVHLDVFSCTMRVR